MTPLPWTTTRPTVPGWYVYQPTPPSVAVVVLVEHTGTGWRAYHAGCSLPVPVHAMPGTWCGPLALAALAGVPLFQQGTFTLHSGQQAAWKVECEALTSADWHTLAALVAACVRFHVVEGVPRGGLPLAEALAPYCNPDPTAGLLIVDDVCTTGASLEAQRAGRAARGVVVFARGGCPPWVQPIWHYALAGDAEPSPPLPPITSRSGVGHVVSTSMRPPLVIEDDDVLVAPACALCVPSDSHMIIAEWAMRLVEGGPGQERICVCGKAHYMHTAQHPHGCASSGCAGWREREEER